MIRDFIENLFAQVSLQAARFHRDEEGVTAMEYGLIAALVAVAIIAAVSLVGTNLSSVFDEIASELGGALSS